MMRASAILLAILYSILVGTDSAEEGSKIRPYNFQHPGAYRIIPERNKQDNEEAGFTPFNPSSSSPDLVTQWWEGPNVCEETNIVEESQLDSAGTSGETGFDPQSTHCIASESAYVCTKRIQTNGLQKTVVVTRQCCHGYMRPGDGRSGCVEDAVLIARNPTTITRSVTPLPIAGNRFSIQEQKLNILNRSKREINVFYLLPSVVSIRLPGGFNGNNPPSASTIRRVVKENSSLPVGIPLSALMLNYVSRSGAGVAINYRFNGQDYVGSRYVTFLSG